MAQSNENGINSLLSIIESKLNWGASSGWVQRDFEKLTDEIYEQTKVDISLSTIKRIWKGDYKKLPNISTLNALAEFAGFKNWQDFKAHNTPKSNSYTPAKKKKQYSMLLVPLVVVLSIILVSYTFWPHADVSRTYTSDEFEFSLKSVSNKTPNTVFFKYKIPADLTDTVFLQQDWDARKREMLRVGDSIVSSIYYYPAFFKTKMILNDSVLREIPLQIFTDGWQSLVSYDYMGGGIPIYVNKEYSAKDEVFHVTLENLRKLNVDFSKEAYWTEYINSQSFPDIDVRDFSFGMTIKNPIIEGGLTCQDVKIFFVFESDYGVVPLCATGCVSNLQMYFCGSMVNGKTADLSPLGIDLDDWNTVKCTVRDKELSVYINNAKAYSLDLLRDGGSLKYIKVSFKGSGSMKNPNLVNSKGDLVRLD